MSLKITSKNDLKCPDHLGGHLNKTHIDYGVFDYLQSTFDIKSMLDIGCATGDMVEYALEKKIRASGIDGDFTLTYSFPCIVHDFCDGPIEKLLTYDLAWSVEFLEHVEKQYMDNYMAAFQNCKYAVITFAPPGWEGHHHVNLQEESYWIDKFKYYGFEFDKKTSEKIREYSTMTKGFMERTGLFFKNRNKPTITNLTK